MENSKTYVVVDEQSVGKPDKTACIYVFASKRKAKSHLREQYRNCIKPKAYNGGSPTFTAVLYDKGRSLIYQSILESSIASVFRMRIVDMSEEEVDKRYPGVPRADMEKLKQEKRKDELQWLYGAKVKDVIAALQTFPQDAKVLVQTGKAKYTGDVRVFQNADGIVLIDEVLF